MKKINIYKLMLLNILSLILIIILWILGNCGPMYGTTTNIENTTAVSYGTTSTTISNEKVGRWN